MLWKYNAASTGSFLMPSCLWPTCNPTSWPQIWHSFCKHCHLMVLLTHCPALPMKMKMLMKKNHFKLKTCLQLLLQHKASSVFNSPVRDRQWPSSLTKVFTLAKFCTPTVLIWLMLLSWNKEEIKTSSSGQLLMRALFVFYAVFDMNVKNGVGCGGFRLEHASKEMEIVFAGSRASVEQYAASGITWSTVEYCTFIVFFIIMLVSSCFNYIPESMLNLVIPFLLL